jgi:hypothetical protein
MAVGLVLIAIIGIAAGVTTGSLDTALQVTQTLVGLLSVIEAAILQLSFTEDVLVDSRQDTWC